MLKITLSPDQLVELFHSSFPYKPRVKSFNQIPYDIQTQYRKTYNIVGHGHCADCGWGNDADGCNVERDSSVCRLNKRLKSAEWQKQINNPRTPVMNKYNIVENIFKATEKDADEYSIHNPIAWDFSPSGYIKTEFAAYINYTYINFADITGNNSEELYNKLIEDSADHDYSSFEAIRMMMGINSGVLILHFPLLMNTTKNPDGVVVRGTTPIKSYVSYAKEGDSWREGFFTNGKLKMYLSNYVRKYQDKTFSPTPAVNMNSNRLLKSENGDVIGICGDSNRTSYVTNKESTKSRMNSNVTDGETPYTSIKNSVAIESAISSLRNIENKKLRMYIDPLINSLSEVELEYTKLIR